jgi:predicted ATP-dependent serine protease
MKKENMRVSKNEDFLVTKSIQEFKEFGKFRFLVDPFIPKGVLIELGGREGSGKSLLALTIIKAILKKEPLWGMYPVPESGPVLLIDEETPATLLKERTEQLGFEGFDKDLFHCLHYRGIKIDNDWDFERLMNLVKAYRPLLVVIDSLVRIHRRGENSATAMAFVSDRLRKIVSLGPTVLFIHHHSKRGESRGSTEIMAGVDVEYSIKKESDKTLLLRSEKTRVKPLDPIKLRIENHGELISVEYMGTIEDTVWKEVQRCLAEDHRCFENILVEVSLVHPDISETTLRRLLRKYAESGWIRPNIDHAGKKPGRPPVQYRLIKRSGAEINRCAPKAL